MTLTEIRVLIQAEPPAGAKVAEGCQFDGGVLASQCGCSLRQLQRIFREFARTPHGWLQERRLLRDLVRFEYLDATGQLESIKRIAIEWGYKHPGHFDRAFRRAFGLSPKEFLAKRERALRTLGIDLTECRRSRRPYPMIDV